MVVVALAAITQGTRAQPEAREVIVTGAVEADAFEILHRAFANDGIAMRRASTAQGCDHQLGPRSEVDARVWMHAADRLVALCFQSQCLYTERVLGPFAKLDARAREELITVIESGLDALALGCAEHPVAEEAPAAAISTVPEPSAGVARASEPPRRAAPRAASARKPAEKPAVTRVADAEPAPTSSAANPVSPTNVPRIQAEEEALHRLFLVMHYGVTRWSSNVLGQYFGGSFAYSLSADALALAFGADYALPFQANADMLTIEARSLRLTLQLWLRQRLSSNWALDVQLGPAVAWLWIAPETSTARLLSEPRSAVFADPYLSARVGPALRVHKQVFVGLELQLDALLNARSYGFWVDRAPRTVFSPDRMRLSLALHVRTEL
jgi:hypothetical protein